MIQFAAVIMALMFVPAQDLTQDSYRDCNGGAHPGRVIEACSTVLKNGSPGPAVNRKLALFYRGYAYQRIGRLDEGFADYRASLAIEPGYFPSQNNLIVGLTSRGSDAYRRKDYDQAHADFTESVALDPANVQSLTNLAALEYKLGKFDRAIAHCTAALAIEPKAVTAYDVCGRAYLGKGDLKNAVIALSNVQTLEPGRTDTDEAQNPDQILDQAKRQLAQTATSDLP